MTKRDRIPTNKTSAKRGQPATKVASQSKSASKKAAPKKRAKAGLPEKNREQQIAEAAYLIAQQRGFEGDCAMDDWLQAEAKIDAKLSS